MSNINDHQHNIELEKINSDQPNPIEPKIKKPTYEKIKIKPVGFFKMFRYAEPLDIFFMIIGSIAACAFGVSQPLFSIVFADAVKSLSPETPKEEIQEEVNKVVLQIIWIGLGTWVVATISNGCWALSGARQTLKVRFRYFRAFFYYDMSWFDKHNANEISSKMSQEITSFTGGVSEKVSNFIYPIATVVSALILSFIKGWQLTLLLFTIFPLLFVMGFLFTLIISLQTTFTETLYEKSGAIAEQAIHGIRTVIGLCGEPQETKKYNDNLDLAKKPTKKFALALGSSFGFFNAGWAVMYILGFGLGWWAIAKEIKKNEDEYYSISDVLGIFFAMVNGSFAMGTIAPAIKAISVGKSAAARIFAILDTKGEIKLDDPDGKKPIGIQGEIKFHNIHFNYPSKPNIPVLKGIDINIPAGKKVALVGESGCGKSTCMQLIERFYDPDQGEVKIDGTNLKDYNLEHIRNFIGYVNQEPVLFATTIKENLYFGNPNATEEEMWKALEMANVKKDIDELEQKLETYVGVGGIHLSGGQKQRVSIARSILKNPKILLLDEATSALDRKNEEEIQAALDRFSEGRTTVAIAHRLATIVAYDIIYVFEKGIVTESGTHHELLGKNGFYAKLWSTQAIHKNEDQNEAKEENVSEEEEQMPSLKKSESVKEVDSIHHDATHDADSKDKKKHKKQKKPKKQPFQSRWKSIHIEDDSLKEKKKAEAKKIKINLPRIYKYAGKSVPLLILSYIASLLNGGVFPVFGILLSQIVNSLAYVRMSIDMPELRDEANKETLEVIYWYIGISVLSFIVGFAVRFCNSIGAEQVTRKLRQELFDKFLRMHIGWHDHPDHNPGQLTQVLASDAAKVNFFVTESICVLLQSLGCVICGLALSFYRSWIMTLIMLGAIPILAIGNLIQISFMGQATTSVDLPYALSLAVVQDVVTNMRSVQSLSQRKRFLEIYDEILVNAKKKVFANSAKIGFALGISQMLTFGVVAFMFWVGGELIVKKGLTFLEMFSALMTLFFAAMGVGIAGIGLPDMGSAKVAAANIFKILDEPSLIDYKTNPGKRTDEIKGNIEFRDVVFKYPARRGKRQILDKVNLKISAMQKIALVGPSGCGKSTCIQLLTRNYDVDMGEILIEGINIKEYDLHHLRSAFGVVSQEPVLFLGTIEDNIKYSKKHASDEEMFEAAKKANAYNFITLNQFELENEDKKEGVFEEETKDKHHHKDKKNKKSGHHKNSTQVVLENQGTGFQKFVGLKGTQISAGQKQRIAIARAIIRKPKVYLFDEATSALDFASEKIVQELLDEMMKECTTITVAHRFSTIKSSDKIYALKLGVNRAEGTFNELLHQGIIYE